MSDLIEGLRGRANMARDTHPVDAELDDKAADEIERLRAERLAFATESEERQAEIERLRGALGEIVAGATKVVDLAFEAGMDEAADEIERLQGALGEIVDCIHRDYSRRGNFYVFFSLRDIETIAHNALSQSADSP